MMRKNKEPQRRTGIIPKGASESEREGKGFYLGHDFCATFAQYEQSRLPKV